MINLTPTVSLLELVATVISAVGFVVSFWLYLIARRKRADYRAAHRNGAVRIIAWLTVLNEGSRALLQGVFLGLGIFALITVPPLRAAARALADTYQIAFIVLQVVLVGVSVENLRQRRRLAYYVERAYPEKPQGGSPTHEHTVGKGEDQPPASGPLTSPGAMPGED